jgi:hypothetical protein
MAVGGMGMICTANYVVSGARGMVTSGQEGCRGREERGWQAWQGMQDKELG